MTKTINAFWSAWSYEPKTSAASYVNPLSNVAASNSGSRSYHFKIENGTVVGNPTTQSTKTGYSSITNTRTNAVRPTVTKTGDVKIVFVTSDGTETSAAFGEQIKVAPVLSGSSLSYPTPEPKAQQPNPSGETLFNGYPELPVDVTVATRVSATVSPFVCLVSHADDFGSVVYINAAKRRFTLSGSQGSFVANYEHDVLTGTQWERPSTETIGQVAGYIQKYPDGTQASFIVNQDGTITPGTPTGQGAILERLWTFQAIPYITSLSSTSGSATFAFAGMELLNNAPTYKFAVEITSAFSLAIDFGEWSKNYEFNIDGAVVDTVRKLLVDLACADVGITVQQFAVAKYGADVEINVVSFYNSSQTSSPDPSILPSFYLKETTAEIATNLGVDLVDKNGSSTTSSQTGIFLTGSKNGNVLTISDSLGNLVFEEVQ